MAKEAYPTEYFHKVRVNGDESARSNEDEYETAEVVQPAIPVLSPVVETKAVEVDPPTQSPAANYNSRIVFTLVSGEASLPAISGDRLKKKEVRQALSLALQLLANKVFEKNKDVMYE